MNEDLRRAVHDAVSDLRRMADTLRSYARLQRPRGLFRWPSRPGQSRGNDQQRRAGGGSWPADELDRIAENLERALAAAEKAEGPPS